MRQFIMKIDIGNDAMKTVNDLALAVEGVANKLKYETAYGNIYDRNGNRVGNYEIIP